LPSLDVLRAAPASISPFSTCQSQQGQATKRRHRDPYALAKAKVIKAANIARQQVLTKERQAGLGDPVWGNKTPFIESLDAAYETPATSSEPASSNTSSESSGVDQQALNHYLTAADLERSLQYSRTLSEPSLAEDADPTVKQEVLAEHERRHANAAEALSRIISLANANQQDRGRQNIQRCIDTFGRHKTDAILAPRPSATLEDGSLPVVSNKTPRAGPDTGSTEVQVAILTTKIRKLATALSTSRGTKDKMNKRNLRVLVHKRQKLLRYLRESERGGPRWQNLVETLGLTDAAWKGEISL
jgi:ribosomal protein S15